MSTLPPRLLVKQRLGLPNPHRTPQYETALTSLRGADGSVLVCKCCRWTAERSVVEQFEQANEKTRLNMGADPGVAFPVDPRFFCVHHLNHDHSDWRPENLQLVCIPCHYAFHAAMPGLDRRGELLVLPGLTQARLINFWRATLVAKHREDELGGFSVSLLATLRAEGSQNLRAACGVKGDKPFVLWPDFFAAWLANCSEVNYQRALDYTGDLLYLPNDEAFFFYRNFCDTAQASLFRIKPGSARLPVDAYSNF